jgi:hypothetical protein
LIEEDDYNVFKARCESDEAKAKSKKMKDLHDMNIGTHRLGPGGYRAAKHIWKKEDAELQAKGKKNPFDKFPDPQTRNFVRVWFVKDKKMIHFPQKI